MDIRTTGSHIATRFVAYEAPQIESVLTSDELEREVFYAGSSIISCGDKGGGGNNGKGSGGCDNGTGNGGGGNPKNN